MENTFQTFDNNSCSGQKLKVASLLPSDLYLDIPVLSICFLSLCSAKNKLFTCNKFPIKLGFLGLH